MGSVVIKTCSADDLIAELDAQQPLALAQMVHADPPWEYSNAGTRGAAANEYGTVGMPGICETLARSIRIADGDAYLAIWCTFPQLIDFAVEFHCAIHRERLRGSGRAWVPITGGGLWDKSIDNRLGIGFHFRGQVELLLLYRVGKPKPAKNGENVWQAARQTHSEKPQVALTTLCKMLEGGARVVDLYAGETASMARACHRTGLNYVGAELDPARADKARARLKQGDLFHGYPQEALPGT